MSTAAMGLANFRGLAAPANPIGVSPIRRAMSLRRTSSIDTSWPDGGGKPMLMHGHARDVFTAAEGGAIRIVAEDDVRILAAATREILDIAASRRDPEVKQLVGQKGGGYLRGVLAQLLPDELAQGSPLNLLLDDFSGASLVAGWAWSRWVPDWQAQVRGQAPAPDERQRKMQGICSGFQPGASSLADDGSEDAVEQSSAIVMSLPRSDDPDGWHALDPQAEGVGMRRARRIDVWLDRDLVRMDVGFQDSATNPKGGPDRIAIHEYHVQATADLETFTLRSVIADPRVLPYRECPGASPNVGVMIGTRLADLRLAVPRRLSGIVGCTHLNDVLRSLSDVPRLVAKLHEQVSGSA
ncbi:MAG: DUF2889 domain-containing protein [Sphingomonadaceae bacterium]|nr:DUF2889 domain-containing protein [Sphingomonadaceae bacterium]